MRSVHRALVAGAVFVLLPSLFCLAMRREAHGSLTILTLRGTDLRLYQSDSGNFALARRTQAQRWESLEWLVTRKSKTAWALFNGAALYLECPFLISDLLHPENPQ